MTEALSLILRASVLMSVTIVSVLLVKEHAREYLGSRTAYTLWSLVPVSFFGAIAGETGLARAVPFAGWLGASWFVGAGAALALMAARYVRYSRDLRLRASALTSPAVVGFLKPTLYLPTDFEARFTPTEQALILAHEGQHIAFRDTLMRGLGGVLVCLNWFNPLSYVAYHSFCMDQELSCDERVMRRYYAQRKSYAMAMVKAQGPAGAASLLAAFGTRSKKLLHRRIERLRHGHPSRTVRAVGVSLCLMLVVVVLSLV